LPRRSWKEGYRGFKLPFSLQHFLNSHVTGMVDACGARQVSNRNEWLATMFHDLADSPADRILDLAAGQWTRQRFDWLTRLTKALDETAGADGHLANFMSAAIHELRNVGVPAFSPDALKGPPDHLRGEAVLDFWRAAWRDFAAGLRAWPEIREVAADYCA
ncbi:MAG: hypothetical protein R3212_10470, partial [Xanthomonadales bacterium]|nr:hypothetical protein [Xanthomonadales bacterium]